MAGAAEPTAAEGVAKSRGVVKAQWTRRAAAKLMEAVGVARRRGASRVHERSV